MGGLRLAAGREGLRFAGGNEDLCLEGGERLRFVHVEVSGGLHLAAGREGLRLAGGDEDLRLEGEGERLELSGGLSLAAGRGRLLFAKEKGGLHAPGEREGEHLRLPEERITLAIIFISVYYIIQNTTTAAIQWRVLSNYTCATALLKL